MKRMIYLNDEELENLNSAKEVLSDLRAELIAKGGEKLTATLFSGLEIEVANYSELLKAFSLLDNLITTEFFEVK